MPLIKSSSNTAREKNTQEMRQNHSLAQALAASYRIQREATKKKRGKSK